MGNLIGLYLVVILLLQKHSSFDDAFRQFSSNDTVTEDVESTRGGEDVRIAVCRPYVVGMSMDFELWTVQWRGVHNHITLTRRWVPVPNYITFPTIGPT